MKKLRAAVEAVQHDHFGTVRLGKKAKVADRRTLQFARYLRTAAGTLGIPRVPSKLLQSPTIESRLGHGWGMMRNDTEGDCTCAAIGHAIQTWSALAGTAVTPSDDDVQQVYIPGTGSQDDGRDMLGVLNYMVKVGMGSHKIGAFAEISRKSSSSHRMVRAAIDLFGTAYLGVALPVSAQGQSEWTVVPGPTGEWGSWGGHAINAVDYDKTGLTIVTWGYTVRMSWGFFAKYCDEAYAIVSPDFLVGGKTPRGFDVAALQADLEKIHA